MAKTSGGIRPQQQTAKSTANIPPNTAMLLSAVQSGKYAKMPRAAQSKLMAKINQEMAETSTLPQNFTSKEVNALDVYASVKYQTINGELRSGKISKSTQKIVDQLDGAMDKNVLTHDVIVYRGTDGATQTNKAYTSTTVSAHIANGFAKGSNISAYRIPKGTKCAYIGGGEKELLLPRGFDLNKHKLK